MRRSRRHSSHPQIAPAFGAALGIFSTGHVYTADRYVVDGVSGKVASFTDWINPARNLAQATSANQVAVPSADASLNSKLSANFTGSEFYQSSLAASAWKFLHDGTGMWVVHVFVCKAVTNSRYMLATRDAGGVAGTDIGFAILRNTSPNYIFNGRNDTATFLSATIGAAVLDEATYVMASYSESASPKYDSYKKSVQGGNGSPSDVPSTADPSGTLTLGARAGSGSGTAGNRDIGRWAATFIRPSIPTAAERVFMRNMILGRWAITA